VFLVESSIKFVSDLEPSIRMSINSERPWYHSKGGLCSRGSFAVVQRGRAHGACDSRVDGALEEHCQGEVEGT
jgi:hypothetical protein